MFYPTIHILAATSTDPRYHAYCFDKLTNLSANHFDCRIVLNRGLSTSNDNVGGLGLRGRNETNLLESFDSNQMVKNLCASQQYHHMDMFLTFTCNQRDHFGVRMIKREKHVPGFHDFPHHEKVMFVERIHESASCLLLRMWQEVCRLFMTYLRKSPTSPYRDVLSIFIRNEYQKDVGNLSHIHLLLEIKKPIVNGKIVITPEHIDFLTDLVRANIFDIVRTEEIQTYIDEGLYKEVTDYHTTIRKGKKFLPHLCNERCKVRFGPGPNDFRCRKVNNAKVTTDNTKHIFKPMPNTYSKECNNRLVKAGLAEFINDDGHEEKIKYNLDFFNPTRHVAPTNLTDDLNISPVESRTFTACESMQNAQILTHSGGSKKYCCKYVSKVDEQNYTVVKVNNAGQLVTRTEFLANTKVSSSKYNEDLAMKKRKDDNRIRGRTIGQIEMLHHMLQYPEVITDMSFINISTLPLELRAGVEVFKYKSPVDVEDGQHVFPPPYNLRSAKNFQEWRQMSENDILTYTGLLDSHVSVDRVSQFSLRPPEFRCLFDAMGEYFRWFEYIKGKRVTDQQFNIQVKEDIYYTIFVDSLMCQVKIRYEAFDEIMTYIDNLDQRKKDTNAFMISYFHDVYSILKRNPSSLNEQEKTFLEHIEKNIIMRHEDGYLLPVPVFTYVNPTQYTQFLLHILLSMGRFHNEIELNSQPTFRDQFRVAGLIGPSNEHIDLQRYSNELLKRYIVEQLQHFPNSKHVIDNWIVAAGNLFDDVIINDEIPIYELPPVQLTSLRASIETDIIEHSQKLQSIVIEAALNELGDDTIQQCGIPSKDVLLNVKKDDPLDWDVFSSFVQNERQPTQSYHEQKTAIDFIKRTIDKYCTPGATFTKSAGIRGFPGSGKTWTMLMCVMYAKAKGLKVITSAQMSRRSIQIGGKHLAFLFCLPYEKGLTTHRKAEMAVLYLERNPKKWIF